MKERKHRWEFIGAEPSVCLNSNQRHFPAYERCKDCCVTRTAKTENQWCENPQDGKVQTALAGKEATA